MIHEAVDGNFDQGNSTALNLRKINLAVMSGQIGVERDQTGSQE